MLSNTRTVALLIALVLPGCATQAQREATTIRSTAQEAQVAAQACVDNVIKTPEYLSISSHLPINLAQVTLAQETDSSYATDEQIKAIYAVDAQLQPCRSALVDKLNTAVPTVAAEFAAWFGKNRDELIALVQRKEPWGEYVRNASRIATEEQTRLTAEEQKLNDRLRQENAAEIEQRQRAAAAVAQYLQNQQAINALNRPVVTTTQCTGFGNTLNCTGISN